MEKLSLVLGFGMLAYFLYKKRDKVKSSLTVDTNSLQNVPDIVVDSENVSAENVSADNEVEKPVSESGTESDEDILP